MSMENRKSSCIIGRRTRVNVLKGKTIRKDKDGGDVFEDYWTDSDEENSNHSSKSSYFFKLSLKSQNGLSNCKLSDFTDSDQMDAISELHRETPKCKAKLSKSGMNTSLPLSSSPENIMSSLPSVTETMSKAVRETPKRSKAKLSKSGMQTSLPLSPSQESRMSSLPSVMETMSKAVRETPKRSKAKLSNSVTKTCLPLSSSKTFLENRKSLSYVHEPRNVVCNLDKEVFHEMSQHISSVSSNDDDEEVILSSLTQNKNSETAKSDKIQIKRKSVLAVEKILSNYDKYDAVIMKMIHKNNSQNSPKNDSSKTNSSKLIPNSNNDDSSPVNNIDGEQNFDLYELMNTKNRKDISGEINSPEKVNSPRTCGTSRSNKLSNLSFHTSPDKNVFNENKVQTKLNFSKKSLSKPDKIEEKENSPGKHNVYNSEKGTSSNMSQDSDHDSTTVQSCTKLNSLNLFEKSNKSFQVDKDPGKTDTRSKRKSLRNISYGHANENHSSVQEDLNKSYSLKSADKCKQNSRKDSLSQTTKNIVKLNTINKKQKIAAEEVHDFLENELNESDHESQQLLMKDTAQKLSIDVNGKNVGERQTEKKENRRLRKQNSSNFFTEQKQSHEPLQTSKKPVKSNVRNKKQKIAGDETNDFQENELKESDHESQQLLLQDTAPKLCIDVNGKNVGERQTEKKENCGSGKQNSSNSFTEQKQSHEPLQTSKNAVKSNIENKKQKIAGDEINDFQENELNESDHESRQQHMEDTAPKLSIAVNEKIVGERQTEKKENRVSRKQNSNFSTEKEILYVNSHANSLSPERHNIDSRKKHSSDFKSTEKQIGDGKIKERSQLYSSNQHEKQTSVFDFSVQNEQLSFTSDDNHLPIGSKRKHSVESSKTETQSHNKKSKYKSIPVKSNSHKLSQYPVDDLSAVQKLPLNKSLNPQPHKKNSSKKKQSYAKSENSRKKSFNKEQVRRSGRPRYAPLAHWRNERLLYRYEKGNIKILGIDKGFEDIGIGTPVAIKKKDKKKKSKISRIKKVTLYDNKLEKKVRTHMHKSFESVPWDTSENIPYRIKRIFETVNSAFGYLEINGLEKKPPQHMPEEDLQLTIVKGEVEIQIQENSFKAQSRDMFIIPRRTVYSIINLSKTKALLTFSVGKFKFLESPK